MDCNRARTKEPGEWLETCPDFSAPLAERLTEWILNWEPDLAESIKWNNLCFSGRKLVVGLSACQRHLALFFFRGTELPDPAGIFSPGGENNTNIRSIRLTTLDGVNRAAAESFRALAPSCQREYLVWLSTAKRPETRARRLAETLRAITAGRKWAQRRLA